MAPNADRPHDVLKLRERRLREAVRRDALFLAFGLVAFAVVSYVENNASDAEIRRAVIKGIVDENVCADGEDGCAVHTAAGAAAETRIIDAGFILTSPLHAYLARNRDVNDALAMANSALLAVPLLYAAHVTAWRGDFRLSFRLIATQLFRSLCGWFTYLPVDPEFLSSRYDFPEILLCRFRECSGHGVHVQANFLTFFSGHVATIVIIANHLYMAKYTRMSVCLHCFNWLQAARLLATRGHYSIDLIIGYVVAVFVSTPADRMGWYYSRGAVPVVPGIVETFEILVGANADGFPAVRVPPPRVEVDCLHLQQSSSQRPNGTSDQDDLHNVQSETTVRIAVDIVSGIAQLRRR